MTGDTPTTRRALLVTAATAAVGIAGCSSSGEVPESSGTETNRPTDRRTTAPGTTPPGTTESTPEPTTETTTQSPVERLDPDAVRGAGRTRFAEPPDDSAVLATFDRFNQNWSVASGQATAQSRVVYHGDRSVHLNSAGDRRVRITRSFDGYRDLSGLDFSLAVCLQGTSKAALQPHVVLRDVNGNHRVYSAALSSIAPNRWVRLDLGLEVDEGIDMTLVDSVAVGEYVGGRESRFLIDDLQVREKPDTGLVAFSFEDSHRLDYDLAYPTLSEYDFDGAIFAPAASMNETEDPSLSEFRTMRDAGWDVGAHTMEHERLPDYSREKQRRILEENVEFLRAIGFEEGRHYFRTTQGAYDDATQDIVRDLFRTTYVPQGKATGTAASVTDPHMIGFKGGDDYERSKQLVDVAAEHRQFLGLTLHMRNLEDREAFRSLIDHVAAHVDRGNLRVVTPSTHYAEYVESTA